MGDIVSYRGTPSRKPRRQPARGSSWLDAARGLGWLLVAAPLALFSAILLADGPSDLLAFPQSRASASPGGEIVANARFRPCDGERRFTCVVDGDTIWLEGTKIRIADIDVPEMFSPGCAAEGLATRWGEARRAWC